MIVYKATNLINKKVYIGKTVRTLSHAKARHHQRAKFQWKYGTYGHFYSAIRKYGFESFKWQIIYRGSSDAEIQDAERRLIAELKANSNRYGYNMTPGGDGGAGKVLSKEQKKKLSDAFSGENNPQAGKFGKDHPAYGHRKTAAQRKRISEAHKGKKFTDSHKKAISAARKAISRFTQDDYEDMRFRYECLEATADIAHDYSTTVGTILKILRREFPDVEIREQRIVSPRKRAEHEARKATGAYSGENAGPSKVSDKDRRAICKRRAAGESYASIAEDYPLGLTGIRAVVKTWGPQNGYPFNSIVASKDIVTKLSDKDRKAICKLHSKGISVQVLAKDYSVGETTAYTVLTVWGPANGFPYTRNYRKKS